MTHKRADFIGQVCICGRSLEDIHCPQCGTTNAYALSSKTETHIVDIEGKAVEREFGVYRCRRRGHVFSEYDLIYHCEAPPTVALRHSQNRVREADESLRKALDRNDMPKRLATIAEMLKGDPILARRGGLEVKGILEEKDDEKGS